MKNFSQIVNERSQDATGILQTDITQYLNKLKKSLPVDVQKAIYITSKYNIGSKEAIDEIRTANKSKLSSLVDKYNVPINDLEDLWQLLKGMKQSYKVMPQYLSQSERELIEKGQLALDDATIDLESQAGRNAVSKLYTPMVLKIVNQWVGKSSLDKASLISAGMAGLADAINDWKREPDAKTGRVVPFKTYAGFRIKQQILNDINSYSHGLSGTNWYSAKQASDGKINIDTTSLDSLNTAIELDHIGALGANDTDKNDESRWKKLFNELDRKFTQRDTDIFYRFFGVNGRTKEKSKDIAKSYGMSEGNIQNSVIKKMIKYIKNNKTLTDMLLDILNIYTESLMKGMCGMDREQIVEVFAGDDIYLLLEDTTRWESRSQFMKSYTYAMNSLAPQDKTVVIQALEGGFAEVDRSLRRNANIYKKFVRTMNPTSGTLTDGDLIDDMVSISNYYLKYK
jgi:DNA-directed RNA polymerase sigma subunit (sigma70/sigma32)